MIIRREDKVKALKKGIESTTSISQILKDIFNVDTDSKTNKASCPFHSDSSPSFSIDRTDTMFKCFGCDRGGKAFELLYMANKEGIIQNPPQLAIKQGYDQFLLTVANYYKVPHNYKNMETEFTTTCITEQVDNILYLQKRVKNIEPIESMTLQMRFNNIRNKFIRKKITIEELLEILTKLQHEEVDNPSNLDELYTSISTKLDSLTLEDLMGD